MNRVLKFTRSEGGNKIDMPFELYEHDINKYDSSLVEKREVFSKVFNRKITSRVIKIKNLYIHAVFLEDGKVYDVHPSGFILRKLESEAVL